MGGLGIERHEIPDCVIVEGSWWREERQEWRLGYLTDVREFGFPDIYLGRHGDRTIAFCMAYGAPRAVEIITMFAAIGTRLAIQIGTCGGCRPSSSQATSSSPTSCDARTASLIFMEQIRRRLLRPLWRLSAHESCSKRVAERFESDHM